MYAVAPGVSLVLQDFYILLYTADIHTSGFGPVVFPHKTPFPKLRVCDGKVEGAKAKTL